LKVNIGPFRRYWNLYGLLFHFNVSMERADKIYNWIEKHANWILTLIEGLNNLRPRKVKIKIHAYDAWNADSTLAMIIHPVLVELKKAKKSASIVDLEDVPEELHPPKDEKLDDPWDLDSKFFDRWDYVLDEMIWAFKAHVDCEDLSDEGILRQNRAFKLFGKYFNNLWS